MEDASAAGGRQVTCRLDPRKYRVAVGYGSMQPQTSGLQLFARSSPESPPSKSKPQPVVTPRHRRRPPTACLTGIVTKPAWILGLAACPYGHPQTYPQKLWTPRLPRHCPPPPCVRAGGVIKGYHKSAAQPATPDQILTKQAASAAAYKYCATY